MMAECGCPTRYPDWDGQDIDLGGWYTHTLTFPTLFHMPLAYEAYLQRQNRALEQLELKERWPGLVLTRTGMFRGSITRLLEEGTSLSRHVRHLPSPFMVRAILHHGNVSTLRGPLRESQMALLDAGRMPREVYLCHLTCPRCERERGGEKILLLRRWVRSPALEKKRQKTRTKKP
ncbi:MAG TPA: hypothetical protein ENK48_05775 [Gammaproteobacteria bacterium]|nr:hypothetical protein [Gammaproteobacteria bacterium]